jgi:hypothetical protein
MKRLVVICSLLLVPMMSLHAQFTFSDGFESGNFSVWDSVNNVHADTTIKHSGTYSAKFTGTGPFTQMLIKHIPTSAYVRIEYFVYISSWSQAYASFGAGSLGSWNWNPWATCGSYVNNCSRQRIGGSFGACAGVVGTYVPINCPMNQWNHFVLERTSSGNLKGSINNLQYFDLFADSCLADSIVIMMTANSALHITGYIDDVSIAYIPNAGTAFDVAKDWNLVSVPAIVSDYRKAVLFPSSATPAYAYVPGGGYIQKDTLENGPGYWLKFDSAQTVTMRGVVLRNVDTIDVDTGWNIVGSISAPVDVEHIVVDPPGILVSPFYEWVGAYLSADTLLPGQGYWVKANRSGSVVLSSTPTRRARAALDPAGRKRTR